MLETLGRLGVRTQGIIAPVPPTPDDDNLDTLAEKHLHGASFKRYVLPSVHSLTYTQESSLTSPVTPLSSLSLHSLAFYLLLPS